MNKDNLPSSVFKTTDSIVANRYRQTAKRQQSQVLAASLLTSTSSKYKCFRIVSHQSSEFLRVPVTIGGISWKDMRLYCRFLDLKAQYPNLGTFKIFHSNRAYQRDVKKMIAKGWVWRESGSIKLRAYPTVWRLLGIKQVKDRGVMRFRYWKLRVCNFSTDRKEYLKEIEAAIHKRIAKRKAAQLRYALSQASQDTTQATFSSRSAARTFGYRSTSTGSKIRKKYFEVLPDDLGLSKWRWNNEHGRFEERTKRIAL